MTAYMAAYTTAYMRPRLHAVTINTHTTHTHTQTCTRTHTQTHTLTHTHTRTRTHTHTHKTTGMHATYMRSRLHAPLAEACAPEGSEGGVRATRHLQSMGDRLFGAACVLQYTVY